MLNLHASYQLHLVFDITSIGWCSAQRSHKFGQINALKKIRHFEVVSSASIPSHTNTQQINSLAELIQYPIMNLYLAKARQDGKSNCEVSGLYLRCFLILLESDCGVLSKPRLY